jgi:hypothetical protein
LTLTPSCLGMGCHRIKSVADLEQFTPSCGLPLGCVSVSGISPAEKLTNTPLAAELAAAATYAFAVPLLTSLVRFTH